MSTTVEVKCDDETHLYWREVGTSSWAQLAAVGGPTIEVISTVSVTFEFVQYSSSAYAVWYKDDPGSTPQQLPTSSGPSVNVTSGSRNQVHFAKSSGGPYSSGYVKVSGDG